MTTLQKFAVIGDPIAQSLSPRIHSTWFRDFAINASYERVHMSAENFESGMKSLEKARFRGLNVTMPHKISAARRAVSASDLVTTIGAANTLTWTDRGWRADNTDVHGFDVLAQDVLRQSPSAGDGPILLIGAGGAAAAVAHWASITGRPVTIANRTVHRAQDLVTRFLPETGRAVSLDSLDGELQAASLVVNMIAIGQIGAVLNLPAGDGRAFIDISYGPKIRPAIDSATARGWVAADGLLMLVAQAAAAFEIWHGISPDPRPLYETLRRELLEAASS